MIIDEVQNPPFATLEELRLLSNLTTGDRAPPQTCLMGSAQFLDVMRSVKVEQLCQPIFISDHLGALEESEVGSYVQHRVQVDDGVFPAISANTDGVPCRINMICSRVRSYLNETHRICYADICEVAKEWLFEPDAPPAPLSAAVGKRSPKIEQGLNGIGWTPSRRESPLNRLVTDFER